MQANFTGHQLWSATLSPVRRVEYISVYRELAQMQLAMLGGFALKICIYTCLGALMKGYDS
jgi:hypothetical protein